MTHQGCSRGCSPGSKFAEWGWMRTDPVDKAKFKVLAKIFELLIDFVNINLIKDLLFWQYEGCT